MGVKIRTFSFDGEKNSPEKQEKVYLEWKYGSIFDAFGYKVSTTSIYISKHDSTLILFCSLLPPSRNSVSMKRIK